MILICKGADFSANKIGTVSVKAVSSIAINGASSVTGMNTQLTCTATYSDNTTGTVSPLWSIVSGGEYATIGSNGVMTILAGANNSSVVVSAEYDGKTATKTVTVTFQYAETYVINVADFTTNNGRAATIQSDYGDVSNSNSAYTCILPCMSGCSLNILCEDIEVSGVTYSPGFRIVGMVANAYGTSDGSTNNAARINKYSEGSSQYIAGKRYNGQIYSNWGAAPTDPITIPYQYDSSLTTKATNVPYIAISVLFRNNGTDLANLAQYASQIELAYSITSE